MRHEEANRIAANVGFLVADLRLHGLPASARIGLKGSQGRERSSASPRDNLSILCGANRKRDFPLKRRWFLGREAT